MTGTGIALFGMWVFIGLASLADAHEHAHSPATKHAWNAVLGAAALIALLGTIYTGFVEASIAEQQQIMQRKQM